jgi:hypothetical protein
VVHELFGLLRLLETLPVNVIIQISITHQSINPEAHGTMAARKGHFMCLDDKKILSIARNCLSVEKTGNGLVPIRFTERQLETYCSQEAWKIRSRCPSGVCLDMLSDTGSIAIEYETGGRARNWAYFDLYVDGALTAHAGDRQAPVRDRIEFNVSGEKRERRITIYLPHCLEIFIRGIEVDDNARVCPAPLQPRKLLMLGDSITQGMEALHPSST